MGAAAEPEMELDAKALREIEKKKRLMELDRDKKRARASHGASASSSSSSVAPGQHLVKKWVVLDLGHRPRQVRARPVARGRGLRRALPRARRRRRALAARDPARAPSRVPERGLLAGALRFARLALRHRVERARLVVPRRPALDDHRAALPARGLAVACSSDPRTGTPSACTSTSARTRSSR
jgi:hypothetical protein